MTKNLRINNVKKRILFLSPIVEEGLCKEFSKEDFFTEGDKGVIGKGGYGQVYKVRHKESGKVCVIKVISKKCIIEQKMEKQINREIEIMYKLNHPHIIKLLNHFEDNDNLFLVMELASKGQLYTLLKKEGRFSQRRTAQYLREIINAIQYIHSFDPPIIHRDIKPENILLDENGRCKLADFGWSNYCNMKNNELRKTYCGTLPYLAPEMIKKEGHDTSIDIWQLGVLTFELLTGRPPFTGKNKIELFSNIKKIKIDWPVDNSLNPLAKSLIGMFLIQNPKERPSLEQILNHAWFSKNPPFYPVLSLDKSYNVNSQYENLLLLDKKNYTKEELHRIYNLFNNNNSRNINNKKLSDSTYTCKSAINIKNNLGSNLIENKQILENSKKLNTSLTINNNNTNNNINIYSNLKLVFPNVGNGSIKNINNNSNIIKNLNHENTQTINIKPCHIPNNSNNITNTKANLYFNSTKSVQQITKEDTEKNKIKKLNEIIENQKIIISEMKQKNDKCMKELNEIKVELNKYKKLSSDGSEFKTEIQNKENEISKIKLLLSEKDDYIKALKVSINELNIKLNLNKKMSIGFENKIKNLDVSIKEKEEIINLLNNKLEVYKSKELSGSPSLLLQSNSNEKLENNSDNNNITPEKLIEICNENLNEFKLNFNHKINNTNNTLDELINIVQINNINIFNDYFSNFKEYINKLKIDLKECFKKNVPDYFISDKTKERIEWQDKLIKDLIKFKNNTQTYENKIKSLEQKLNIKEELYNVCVNKKEIGEKLLDEKNNIIKDKNNYIINLETQIGKLKNFILYNCQDKYEEYEKEFTNNELM